MISFFLDTDFYFMFVRTLDTVNFSPDFSTFPFRKLFFIYLLWLLLLLLTVTGFSTSSFHIPNIDVIHDIESSKSTPSNCAITFSSAGNILQFLAIFQTSLSLSLSLFLSLFLFDIFPIFQIISIFLSLSCHILSHYIIYLFSFSSLCLSVSVCLSLSLYFKTLISVFHFSPFQPIKKVNSFFCFSFSMCSCSLSFSLKILLPFFSCFVSSPPLSLSFFGIFLSFDSHPLTQTFHRIFFPSLSFPFICSLKPFIISYSLPLSFSLIPLLKIFHCILLPSLFFLSSSLSNLSLYPIPFFSLFFSHCSSETFIISSLSLFFTVFFLFSPCLFWIFVSHFFSSLFFFLFFFFLLTFFILSLSLSLSLCLSLPNSQIFIVSYGFFSCLSYLFFSISFSSLFFLSIYFPTYA